MTDNKPRYAVVLSGCGVYDGSEIHEAVACLHAIEKHGGQAVCLAPDKDLRVVNHRTGEETGETRNVLTEAARIARGNIQDIAKAGGGAFDAVVLPGGFGAAKNLCDFATRGPDCVVDEATARFLKEAHGAGRPIGFACISPALAARVFGDSLKPTLTIGNDAGVAGAIVQMGATHEDAPPDGVVIDEPNRIVSTPCYMYDSDVTTVFTGCDRMVGEVARMVASEAPTVG